MRRAADPSANRACAPDDDQDAGEPSRSTDHAVEEADNGVRSGTSPFDLRELGSGEIVKAEQDQQDADRNAQMNRCHPSQQEYSEGHANSAAEKQGDKPTCIKGMAQFPDGITLNEQPISDDERRSLDGSQRVQPDSGCNQAEGEARNASDESCGKRADDEYRKIEWDNAVHGFYPGLASTESGLAAPRDFQRANDRFGVIPDRGPSKRAPA